MRLQGRNAIVTGGSTGLGYAVAAAFLQEGANVAICGRNPEQLQEAGSRLNAAAAPGSRAIAVVCDVSREEQVQELASRTLDEFGAVTILVNNAGVIGPIGKLEDLELHDWRTAMEINLFGVVSLCRVMLPHLRSRGYGKIVNLSGGGATSPRPFFGAYAASKAAVVRFTENLAEELRGSNIDVNAVAPGALNTRMFEETLAAGPERLGDTQFHQVLRQKESGGSSMERAADLCVYLSSAESDGITGKLISAPWDPWPELSHHLEELRTTDIYTLRRILPEDRAKQWS
jgi:NAD(P)-dependent dehydrogenase (short-subunit alcohol dehydrogenase family)